MGNSRFYTGGAFTGNIGNKAGFITYPCKNAFAEAVIFREIDDAFCNTAAESAEVAGISLQLDAGHFVDQGIEATLEKRQDLAFAAAVLIGGYNVILRLLVQNPDHVPDDLRPLLQISIDEGNVFTGSLLHASVDTGFFAEVSRKGNDLDRAFLGIKKLA